MTSNHNALSTDDRIWRHKKNYHGKEILYTTGGVRITHRWLLLINEMRTRIMQGKGQWLKQKCENKKFLILHENFMINQKKFESNEVKQQTILVVRKRSLFACTWESWSEESIFSSTASGTSPLSQVLRLLQNTTPAMSSRCSYGPGRVWLLPRLRTAAGWALWRAPSVWHAQRQPLLPLHGREQLRRLLSKWVTRLFWLEFGILLKKYLFEELCLWIWIWGNGMEFMLFIVEMKVLEFLIQS